jgi:hypothetical protein
MYKYTSELRADELGISKLGLVGFSDNNNNNGKCRPCEAL